MEAQTRGRAADELADYQETTAASAVRAPPGNSSPSKQTVKPARSNPCWHSDGSCWEAKKVLREWTLVTARAAIKTHLLGKLNLGDSELVLAINLLDRAGGSDFLGLLADVVVESLAHVVIGQVIIHSLPRLVL